MNVLKAIALAEIRHAELLEQAEQHRLAQHAAASGRAISAKRRGWRLDWTALRARLGATRRPDLASPADFAPAATEPA